MGIPLFEIKIKIPLPANIMLQCCLVLLSTEMLDVPTETMRVLNELPIDMNYNAIGPEFNVNESTTCIKYMCL